MAMKIEVVSDVSKVVAETGKLADKYDDVSDTLKDLAKAGESAGDRIESAFDQGVDTARKLADKTDDATDAAKDLGKAGERAGDDIADGLKDGEKAAKDLDKKADAAFDAISDGARRSGKDVGRAQKEGFKDAESGVQEFGDEANSTAKETAASFDGSAESIVGSFQEIAANAFAGFGPAGAAAGLAMAVGLGMAVTAMTEGAESATAMKQKAVDMVDKIAEAGGDLSKLDLADTIKAWGREVLEDNWVTFWADESSTKFQETAKDAKTYGVAARDAIRAASGTVEDSRKFLDKTADSWQELTRKIDAGRSVNEQGLVTFDESAKAAMRQREALSDLRGQAEENIKTTENSLEIYTLEADALGATEEAAQAAADAIKAKADATTAAADAALGVVGAENDWIETLAQMTKDIATNGKNLDSNTEAGRANKESLVDLAESANGYRDAAIAAGDSTASITARAQGARDAFIKQAEAAGYSGEAAKALADKYGLIPGNVETLVKANGTEEAAAAIAAIPKDTKTDVAVTATGTAETQGAIDAVKGKEADVAVKATGTAETQGSIDAVKGKDVKVDVDDDYTVKAVQDRINGIKGKDVYVNLRIGNERDFLTAIDRLTAERSLTVTVNERKGTPVI